jgi:small ligand-binding sensory domain FIST
VPFAAALSTHPITAHAVGEVAGQVLEQLGPHPDLVLLFVTRPHAGALEDAASAVRHLLSPTVLLGCAAESVVGPGLEIEDEPAVSLWAGIIGPVAPIRLSAASLGAGSGAHTGDPPRLIGWPDALPFDPQALIVIGDPYTFPVDALFADLAERYPLSVPPLPVLGGMASAARGPGGNRLALDDRIHTSGAVGAVIGPGTRLSTVVSQGCRPIGRPLVVTRSERNIVYELAGQPALERLLEMARAGMSERDISLINRGLHLGLVIDEHKAEFGRGDFLVRNVLGADQDNGAMAIGDIVEVGTTVQFQVRDADAADEDLRELLAPRTADAALLFTCNGRGSRLFDEPNHDAGVVSEALDDPPVAGFFAAGELGPVGGRNFMHSFTASLALFEEMNTL